MNGVLNKLFSRKKSQTPLEATRPVNQAYKHSSPKQAEDQNDTPELLAAYAQSVGKQRDHNEDALFVLTSVITRDHSYLPFGLYIVADGMGGHQHGEIASEIAVRAVAGQVIQNLYPSLSSLHVNAPEESIQEILREGILNANLAILKEAPGGGTTLTCALVLGDQLTIAHVGDSRAYLISPDGNMQVLTRDHSLVKQLEEIGQITAAEAAVHPQRNLLYRALGQGEPFDPDIATSPLPPNCWLLLCSDGLWGVVSDKELAYLIASDPNPQQACQWLIAAANAGGGPDNSTAILVRLREAAAPDSD